jgi:hypothetical protein
VSFGAAAAVCVVSAAVLALGAAPGEGAAAAAAGFVEGAAAAPEVLVAVPAADALCEALEGTTPVAPCAARADFSAELRCAVTCVLSWRLVALA